MEQSPLVALQAKRKAFEDDHPRFIQYNEANQLHIDKTQERIQALQQTLQEKRMLTYYMVFLIGRKSWNYRMHKLKLPVCVKLLKARYVIAALL